jgi:hypothetical protein
METVLYTYISLYTDSHLFEYSYTQTQSKKEGKYLSYSANSGNVAGTAWRP